MLKNLFFNSKKRDLKIKNYGEKELSIKTLIYCFIVL